MENFGITESQIKVARSKLLAHIKSHTTLLFHGTSKTKAHNIELYGFGEQWNYFETYKPHPETSYGPYIVTINLNSVQDRIFPDPEGFLPAFNGNTENNIYGPLRKRV